MTENNDFSGIDLGVGIVQGLRRWTVDQNGVLQGMQRNKWLPGENRSDCGHTLKRAGDEGWKDQLARSDEWRANGHSLMECECGFYAYFRSSSDGYKHELSVRGVAEGYGEVVIGTKGFRARKARIVALSFEPHGGMWNLDPFYINRVKANYPGVQFFDSELAMLAEFPCPVPVNETVEV